MITDELRESMSPCMSDGWLTIEKSAFEAIADRIDAAHRSALEKVAATVDEPTALDSRISKLESQNIKDALYISELFVRVEQMERKLNHKGGAEWSKRIRESEVERVGS